MASKETRPRKRRRGTKIKILGNSGIPMVLALEEAEMVEHFKDELKGTAATQIDVPFLSPLSMTLVGDFCRGNLAEPMDPSGVGHEPSWFKHFETLEVGP